MNKTPKGNRPHITFLGKRNVGKSSLINVLINQELSIVSDVPGTTTDPVEKATELNPFGPVVFVDTAGYDDIGLLGEKRVKKTMTALTESDLAIIVITEELTNDDKKIIDLVISKNIGYLLVINKSDIMDEETIKKVQNNIRQSYNVAVLLCSTINHNNIEELKESIITILRSNPSELPIISDLLKPMDTVVLVIPIDKEAPKGRLILPQVQTIRECLDADVSCIVVKERELHYTLNHILKTKPKIVITDSQAFLKVNADVADDVLMTSFSILYARQKGDLITYTKGISAIKKLKNNDSILIAELCSHRPISEDIGRVKIPRWLEQYSGLSLNFDVFSGKEIPEDLTKYKLIIQCGGCMANRSLIISRINKAIDQNVPITNYGLIIAYLHGIIERALTPFPEALEYLKS
ncbi:MAG: [FeFe] hydrogenase H-cluster maturation GTPase HydF [Candidatus Margulisbacteria bacterium GWF2_35_9]|nr:MAG: [FeFe] hydrogenase H-cluster maturation GTPase HydF [Candidatus Margulisbacteria bacterium GWF2_35_9]